MTVDLDSVVSEFVDQCMLHSSWHSMRRVPSYEQIERAGEDAISALLRNLASEGGGGMCIMHALYVAAGEWPELESVADDIAPGFVGFSVEDARLAWLRWGVTRGYI